MVSRQNKWHPRTYLNKSYFYAASRITQHQAKLLFTYITNTEDFLCEHSRNFLAFDKWESFGCMLTNLYFSRFCTILAQNRLFVFWRYEICDRETGRTIFSDFQSESYVMRFPGERKVPVLCNGPLYSWHNDKDTGFFFLPSTLAHATVLGWHYISLSRRRWHALLPVTAIVL